MSDRWDGNVFIRRYFFTEPVATIAERYDLTENHVMVILSRARKKLKAELYGNRLHLSENIESVQYESRDSWYFGKEERDSIAQDNEVIRNVIKELDSAEFFPSASVPLENGQSSISDTEQYHLYIGLKNGTNIHLRLHENGYVRFQGFLNLCVQLPEETFHALAELLENHSDTSTES